MVNIHNIPCMSSVMEHDQELANTSIKSILELAVRYESEPKINMKHLWKEPSYSRILTWSQMTEKVLRS